MKSIRASEFYRDIEGQNNVSKRECVAALRLLAQRGEIKILESDIHGNPSSFKMTKKGKEVAK